MPSLLEISGLLGDDVSAFWPSSQFMPSLNVKGGSPEIEARRWAAYSRAMEERPDILARASARIARAREAGVPLSLNVKDPFVAGMLGEGCSDPMWGLLAAAAKRQGPVFSAEKCLEIAERLVAKGNKRMAYLWALRAAKTAQKEKKPELQKRAQELAARLKAELAAQAVAGFGEDYSAWDVPFGTGSLSQGEYWWRAATPALRPLPDINALPPGEYERLKREMRWDPESHTWGPRLPDINALSSLGQDVIQHTLTLHPVLQKMLDSDDFPTRMLGQGIMFTMVAHKVANERKQKAIARVAARLIKAARMAKLIKELGI